MQFVEPSRLVERPCRQKGLRSRERPVHARQVEALLDDALARALHDPLAGEPSVEAVFVAFHPVEAVAEVLELLVDLSRVAPVRCLLFHLLDHRLCASLLEHALLPGARPRQSALCRSAQGRCAAGKM